MANKHLLRAPRHIKDVPTVWWYEETAGAWVVIQDSDGGTRHAVIPWRSLRAALRRKDRKP